MHSVYQVSCAQERLSFSDLQLNRKNQRPSAFLLTSDLSSEPHIGKTQLEAR